MGKSKETMNERVRKIRKALEMNQADFAKKFGLSDSALSRIEIGDNSLTENNVLLICMPNQLVHGKTVNANWLRTGKGKMFVTTVADGRPRLFEKIENQEIELPPDEEELIGVYRELMPENKEYVRDSADKILQAQKNTEAHLRGKPSADKEKGDMRKSG